MWADVALPSLIRGCRKNQVADRGIPAKREKKNLIPKVKIFSLSPPNVGG